MTLLKDFIGRETLNSNININVPLFQIGRVDPSLLQSLSYFWLHNQDLAKDIHQLGLAYPKAMEGASFSDRVLAATGSLVRKKSPYKDYDFTVLLPEMYLLGKLMSELLAEGIETSRPMLRKLLPKTCLSYHKDMYSEFRLHVVLTTNPDAKFVIGNLIRDMPTVGGLYLLRTDMYHSAINMSFAQYRLHATLSGTINKSLPL